MNTESKYIIFDGTDCAWPDFPIIFPNFIEHNTIRRKFSNLEVLSAGMCSFIDEKWACYGQSVSLGKSSSPEDSKTLNKMMIDKDR